MILKKYKGARKLIGFSLLIFSMGFSYLSAQTLAHESSGFAVIDPVYTIDKNLPRINSNTHLASWIYGPAELKCWRLQLLIQRKDSARLLVGYPGIFHKPYHSASFRLKPDYDYKMDFMQFRAVGYGKIYINSTLIAEFNENDSFHSISTASWNEIKEIRFEISSDNQPPALLIENEKISTSSNSWEWKTDTENWLPAYHFPQNLEGVPPHKLEDPTFILQPERKENGLYDFGRELFGYVMIRSVLKPKIIVGESKAEATDTINNILEQSLELEQAKNGFWISKSPLAFRYLKTDTIQVDSIQCKAIFYRVNYRGAFACSDSTLIRIWMNSAYTLHMCMHDFILDGIKRDRLPWSGDLAISMVANAFTFCDPEIVRRSLVALGRAGIEEKDINGIIDYSLWWIIAQDNYQLYFGDTLHLNYEWERIKASINSLSSRCDSSGFLIPEKSWLFIDWVEQNKWTALQILWWWAQESGARLAHRTGDIKFENHLICNAENLKNNLVKYCWSEKNKFWISSLNNSNEKVRHPNFLAVISGLAAEYQFEGIRKILENDEITQVGTPYMAGFENMALTRLGDTQFMIDRVKNYWGSMLELGATTFWEAFDLKQNDKELYAFYDRPYGKSLCHAWSSGPAAILPSGIFGLRPLQDGWSHFTMDPQMGDLLWASVTVPTKYGDIIADMEKGKITIQVPDGTILYWEGKSIAGPYIFIDQL